MRTKFPELDNFRWELGEGSYLEAYRLLDKTSHYYNLTRDQLLHYIRETLPTTMVESYKLGNLSTYMKSILSCTDKLEFEAAYLYPRLMDSLVLVIQSRRESSKSKVYLTLTLPEARPLPITVLEEIIVSTHKSSISANKMCQNLSLLLGCQYMCRR